MFKCVNLDIAGFFIRVSFNGFNGVALCKQPYSCFITKCQEKPDLQINVEINNGQVFENKYLAFDTEFSWKLFKLNKGYLYEDRLIRKSYAKYVRRAFIEDNFRKAKIYCSAVALREKGVLNWVFDLPLGQFLVANMLAEEKGLMLHSCAVRYKDKAFVFMGKSGAGKSTLARLFKKHKEVKVLSDERIVLRNSRGRFIVHGSPWTGSAFAFAQDKASLDRIYLIHHAKKNSIEAIDAKEAFPAFFSNIRLPLWDKFRSTQVLDTANMVLTSIPFFKMGFLPDKRIIDLVLS